MIIYHYYTSSDNALLLSVLLTCHRLSFHEIIFILVPPVFREQPSQERDQKCSFGTDVLACYTHA